MNFPVKIFALASAIGIAVGCSDQGKEAFHEADQSSSQAAQKLVHAAKTDAKATTENLQNQAMAEKVRAALSSASDLDTSNLHIQDTGKVITLTGTVPSQAEKDRASTIAKGIVGKEFSIEDKLEVVKASS